MAEAAPGRPETLPRAPVRMTLRLRILLVVLLIHVVVIGLGVALLGREERRRAERTAHELLDESTYLMAGTIQWQGSPNVRRILQWPSWPRYEDAVLLDRNLNVTPEGRIVPAGVALAPLGAAHRPATFDEQAVYRAIAAAIDRGRPIEDVAGGRVVPIRFPEGIWGGFWYRIPPAEDWMTLFRRWFLGPFLISTGLLTAGTFLAVRRFVLEPVGELASGARRVASGDFSVQLPEPDRNDELADLIRAFNAMTSEVRGFNARLEAAVAEATERARRAQAAAMTQRRLAATGELAAGIAHEINNPLGGLQNAVAVLERGDLTEAKRRRYLELLASGLDRIGNTVRQLLRLTPRAAQPVLVNVLEPVRDALALVRHRALELGVELRLNGAEASAAEGSGVVPGDLPRVRAQPGELGQAVLNLLVNALDAIESGGGSWVDVQVGPDDGGGVRLEVADDGPGVTEEELARIPDLYYTTKEVGRGTGLGLALVFRTADRLGGSVELESRPGEGLRATMRLPAAGEGA